MVSRTARLVMQLFCDTVLKNRDHCSCTGVRANTLVIAISHSIKRVGKCPQPLHCYHHHRATSTSAASTLRVSGVVRDQEAPQGSDTTTDELNCLSVKVQGFAQAATLRAGAAPAATTAGPTACLARLSLWPGGTSCRMLSSMALPAMGITSSQRACALNGIYPRRVSSVIKGGQSVKEDSRGCTPVRHKHTSHNGHPLLQHTHVSVVTIQRTSSTYPRRRSRRG